MTTQSSNLSPQSFDSESSALSPQSSILVTGGAGFIGSNFVHYWLENHPDDSLLVLDALTYAGNLMNLESVEKNPHYRFVHGDIRDYDLVVKLLATEKVDTIVHFAAESHVDRSILGPDAFIDTNIVGTHTLLKAAKKVWLDPQSSALSPDEVSLSPDAVKLSPQSSALSPDKVPLSPFPHRFHHVSTDEVYGSLEPDAPPFKETNPYLPNSPYAASKAGSDHLVRAYHETYGLDITISNCSNNYGPYQFPEKLIPLVIANILDGKPLPIYGDGLQIRDWLYVDDHNRAIDLILQKGKKGETYNIGGNNEWTNINIVKLICNLLDQKFADDPDMSDRFPTAPQNSGKKAESLITHVKDRLGHDRRYAIDAGRITNELGYTPFEAFETGICKTVAWYLENEQWWRNVMDGSYREWVKKKYEIVNK